MLQIVSCGCLIAPAALAPAWIVAGCGKFPHHQIGGQLRATETRSARPALGYEVEEKLKAVQQAILVGVRAAVPDAWDDPTTNPPPVDTQVLGFWEMEASELGGIVEVVERPAVGTNWELPYRDDNRTDPPDLWVRIPNPPRKRASPR